ncbi:hypothetical protein ACNHUS_36280 [Actinomycetes bacterium M1A6_2h]
MTPLRIVVPEEFIMDGMASIPEVGDRVDYSLQFVEARPWTNPDMANHVVAQVEVLNDGRLSSDWVDPHGETRRGTYSMLLNGDGWCAYFQSSRLYEGTAKLTGTLEADWPGVIPIDSETAGTVTGCKLITRVSPPNSTGAHTLPPTDTVGPLREGQAFRLGLEPSVDTAGAASGWVSMGPPRDGPWTREVAVLVALDVGSSP